MKKRAIMLQNEVDERERERESIGHTSRGDKKMREGGEVGTVTLSCVGK